MTEVEREMAPGARRLRQVVLGATFATGLTGLVNEVAWQRALAALLGSDGEAAAAVLATFLGGLAAGYAFFGRLSRRGFGGPTLLRLYAMVEAGIGLWALAFPALFGGLQSLSILGDGAAFDVALAALLLAPPTFLMGATLPLLTQALARDLPDATRLHARVYGTNAAGGFLGALLAGLWLLPALGTSGTLRATGVVNLLVAIVFLVVSARASDVALPATRSEATIAATPSRVYAAAALLLGFAMIALQTVWIRVGALAFGASDLTFAVVVATFVLCLALGSLAVGAARSIPRAAAVACPAAVGLLLAALYPALQYAPYAAHRLRIAVGNGDAAYLGFELGAAGLVLAAGLLPLGLAGASLPLIFHSLRRRMDDLGEVVGQLYAWNTVGSVLGALIGGHTLLLWLDLHEVYRVSVAAIVVATALLARGETRWPGPASAGAAALAVAGLIALPGWDPTELSTGHLRLRTATPASYLGPEAMAGARDGQLVFAADDPVTTVLVTDHPLDHGRVSRAIHTQGKSDGSLIPDYPTMALAGLVPCLLAQSCERTFVIGLGTGVTGGELAELESVERVAVAEISPAVVQALPLFDHGNRGLSKSPKLEIIADDAYRGLLARDETWDVIVSEPSHPWASGVERLYSLEFLVAARERLAPGGVYAQWMHSYEMDDATLALVLRTFAAAFEDVAVWYASGPDLLLLGLTPEVAVPDLARVKRRARQPDYRAGLERAGVGSWWALVAHELIPAGVIEPAALPGPLHTLLHPRLAYRAGRAFFHDERARLPRFVSRAGSARGVRASLVNRRKPKTDRRRRAGVDETCETRGFECATRIAAWRFADPDSDGPNAAREEWAEEHPDHLMPERIEVLTALFGSGLPGLDAESSQRVTDHFLAYYDQTHPFRRKALIATWKACVGPGCRAGLRDARARLDATVAWIEQDPPPGAAH